MTRLVPMAATLCLVLVVSMESAAQVQSLPVPHRPLHDDSQDGPHFRIALDYGIGFGDASGRDFVGGRAFIETDTWRGSVLAGGALQDEGPEHLAVGAHVAFNLLGKSPENGNLWFVDVQGGVGYAKFGDGSAGELEQFDLPLSVTIGPQVPLPSEIVALVELWVAPRIHARYSKLSSTSSTGFDELRGGAGISAGLGLVHTSGAGARVSFEWLEVRSPSADEWHCETALGLGVLYGW